MSLNLRKYSAERCDDLKRRINKLTIRVHMAMHKYLDRPLPKDLQDSLPATSSCLPLVHDIITRALPTTTPSSSYTTPTPPPPTSTPHIVLHHAPYRSYSPPSHAPPKIPLPPIPLSKSSSHPPPPPYRLSSRPLPVRPDTATCMDIGNLAADTIDSLPHGYRRIALLVFDTRHPPNERIAPARPRPRPPPPGGRGRAGGCGGISPAATASRELAVVHERMEELRKGI